MSYDHSSGEACSGPGETRSILQVAGNWRQQVKRKVLRHSQNVWGNGMNSLLASSSLRCQGTLCYQHRWSMVLERSLVRTASNESLRQRPSLTHDSLGNYKNERVPVSLSNQMQSKILDRQPGNQAEPRGLTPALLWEASTYELHSSTLLFKYQGCG